MSAVQQTNAPKRAIVDAHHHFWDPTTNYHPWLCDPEPIPFRYGDYQSLRRPYLIGDFKRDAAHYHLEGSVYIETEWNPQDFAGETRYVESLRKSGLPSVAIMAAHLHEPNVEALLAQHSANDFVRGIRHKPRANASPQSARRGGMMEADWRRGYQFLQKYGLHFELQTPWWHMHEAVDLAYTFPDTPIIINHAGLPADRSEESLKSWAEAMKMIAACEHVAVKISGIGQPGQAWTAEANRRIVLTLIDLFGISRCMFASNFPVDSLCGSFDEIFSGFETIVSDLSEPEKDALFRRNALRFYRMTPA